MLRSTKGFDNIIETYKEGKIMFSGLGKTKNKQDEAFLENICEQIKSYAESRGYELTETYRKVGQNLVTKGIVDSIKK